MSDETGNRATMEFRSMDDLAQAILHARTFGMRDLTVTTVHHPSGFDTSRGRHVESVTTYYLDCSMLTDRAPEDERDLAHVDQVRATVQRARANASKARDEWFAEQDAIADGLDAAGLR